MAECGLPRSDEELRRLLTPEQYKIVRQNGTERAFSNAYWDNKRKGLYLDVVSGDALFSSRDKFDSGTGWPSFSAPVRPGAVKYKMDHEFGMVRIEVRSRGADSHLGHVFSDGPGPGGLRFCINSASLRFVAAEDLEKENLGEFASDTEKPASPPALETAVFAGGCFWGVEAYFGLLVGVVSTRAGYTGGHAENPTYKEVCAGYTNHAEAVRIEYDPRIITYGELLEHFFSIHDPASLNRQGNDIGTQYRSAVFSTSPEQEAAARGFIGEAEKAGRFGGRKVVTDVLPAGRFWEAEEYHQKYLRKNPGGYCHVKLDRVYRDS